jgi:hypothetical protein
VLSHAKLGGNQGRLGVVPGSGANPGDLRSRVLDLDSNNFVPAMPARTTRALDPPGAYRSSMDTGQESGSLLRRRATRLASS